MPRTPRPRAFIIPCAPLPRRTPLDELALAEAPHPAREGGFWRKVPPEAWLIAATLLGSLLVYLPFLGDMRTVHRYWDGPSYVLIAKDGYQSGHGNPMAADPAKPPFYLAHLPGYPALIRALSFIGYERAALAVSILCAALAAILFFRLARDQWKLEAPLWLSFVFLFATPRWLLYRSVAASEPTFLALVLLAVLCFERERFFLAALAGAWAALTRPTGVLVYPAFALLLFLRGRRKEQLPMLLIPAALGGYLLWVEKTFGSAFAVAEPNMHKFYSFVPFNHLRWLFEVNLPHMAEFFIVLALVYGVGILRLAKFPVPMAYAAFQFAFLTVVGSEDWSRFALPMMPFALVLGYRDLLTTRAFRLALPPWIALSVYYCWKAIPLNLCPPGLYTKILTYLHLPG